MASNYDKIREENIIEYGKGTRHLSFLGRLYTERTHFLLELLQNAEDAKAGKVEFRLHDDRLEVFHDGRLFNEKDVRGICGVGEGTKPEDFTQIGKFGIGFKSVYAYTQTPEVHCGDEHFRIQDYVRPYGIPLAEIPNGYTTLFVLPFRNDSSMSPDLAVEEIGRRLKSLSTRTFLFLRNIQKVFWISPRHGQGFYTHNIETNGGGVRQIVLESYEGGTQKALVRWIVFERAVFLPEGNKAMPVEIAFQLKNNQEGKSRIDPVKNGKLVVFFPTDIETRFGFLVQGPYRTTPARDNVPRDDVWNMHLVSETAVLLPTCLEYLRDSGFMTVELIQSLPIRMEDFPDDSMFRPISDSVKKAFKEKPLLPTGEGGFVSSASAKLARGTELRKLLGPKDLERLLGHENSGIQWLSAEITVDRTPELRTYLMTELEIEEVTPDLFARKVDEKFFIGQSDLWMSNFYEFLSDQEGLWKPERGWWSPAGVIRNRPFVRLEDGSHVAPFRGDGSPNVYLPPVGKTDIPVVRRSVIEMRKEGVITFFKKLGIPEVDPISQVLEKILPRYSDPNAKLVSFEQHREDLKQIALALESDSVERRRQLVAAIQKSQLVYAVNAATGEESYCYPEKAYFRSPQLTSYFTRNKEAWFAIDHYSELEGNILINIGVFNSIRLYFRRPDFQGYVVITSGHGNHVRGVSGFDPGCTVDGLKHALHNCDANVAAFIWNTIAIPLASNIRGIVESSGRQNYSYSQKTEKYSPMGKLLAETNWLPGPDGIKCRPSELLLEELPSVFITSNPLAQQLAQQLGMKVNVVNSLAKELGLEAEDIAMMRMLKANPQEYEKFRKLFDRFAGKSSEDKPTFPSRPVPDPQRRGDRVREDTKEAPNKKYEERKRSVRLSSPSLDPGVVLREYYTNEDGQMICQICQFEMPFRKRDGDSYFEAVEAFRNLPSEHAELHLGLCPVCAAKFKEFIKSDDKALAKLQTSIRKEDGQEFQISLGTEKASIRFVERHVFDMRAVLDEKIPSD